MTVSTYSMEIDGKAVMAETEIWFHSFCKSCQSFFCCICSCSGIDRGLPQISFQIKNIGEIQISGMQFLELLARCSQSQRKIFFHLLFMDEVGMFRLIYCSSILQILADKNNLSVRADMVDLFCKWDAIYGIRTKINIRQYNGIRASVFSSSPEKFITGCEMSYFKSSRRILLQNSMYYFIMWRVVFADCKFQNWIKLLWIKVVVVSYVSDNICRICQMDKMNLYFQ